MHQVEFQTHEDVTTCTWQGEFKTQHDLRAFRTENGFSISTFNEKNTV